MSAACCLKPASAQLARFDLCPARLLGDSAYGSAEMLGWLVYEHGIEPHVTVFDKSERKDGSRFLTHGICDANADGGENAEPDQPTLILFSESQELLPPQRHESGHHDEMQRAAD